MKYIYSLTIPFGNDDEVQIYIGSQQDRNAEMIHEDMFEDLCMKWDGVTKSVESENFKTVTGRLK